MVSLYGLANPNASDGVLLLPKNGIYLRNPGIAAYRLNCEVITGYNIVAILLLRKNIILLNEQLIA